MPSLFTRRTLLSVAPAWALAPVLAAEQPRPPGYTPAGPSAPFPGQDPALVRAVVGESHRSLEKVRELVELHPELTKATVDWGFGDWESALGAAAHTGQREIALFLIERGARPDLFTHAMLGHTAAVRAIVEAQPGVQRIHGPHSLTLAHHARAGGDQAREALAYLESLGDADVRPRDEPLDDEVRRVCIGPYLASDGQRLTIAEARGRLQIQVDGWSPRNLFHQGDHVFQPAGASSVRVAFSPGSAGSTRLVISDGTPIAEAVRQES